MFGLILGMIVDYEGCKKWFFGFFVLVGVVSIVMFVFILSEYWLLLLLFYIILVIGFFGVNVFYDVFFVDVILEKWMNIVLVWGFGLGYIGSMILFIISIVVILFV